MGTMTLERFRANLLFDLRNRTDTSTPDGFDATRQDEIINSAYWHLSHPSVFRHRALQARYTIPLVTNTQAYTFTPTSGGFNILAIRSVAHVAATTDDPLAFRTKVYPRDEQWFQERTLVSSGPPRNYMIQANVLGVSPVPTATENGQVLVVTAWREPTALIAGATTVLDNQWDEVLRLGARYRAELHLGYRDLAEATKMDYIAFINEYKDFEQLHGEDWDWMPELRMDSAMGRA